MKTRRRDPNSIPKPGQKQVGRASPRALPAWKDEHSRTLHHICKVISARVQHGGKVRPLAARAARRWNGKAFRCDPRRKFSLSTATLLRRFYAWKAGGQIPAAVRLQYRGAAAHLPAPVMVRFLEFCLAHDLPSLKAAWLEFSQRPGLIRSVRAYSYGQVQKYFGGAAFRAIQEQRSRLATAQAELIRLRVEHTARLRRELPDRPKRKRRTSAEVSLDSSAL